MIVPRLLGGGNKSPHGEYVDQLVVESLIGECVGSAARPLHHKPAAEADYALWPLVL